MEDTEQELQPSAAPLPKVRRRLLVVFILLSLACYAAALYAAAR